MIETIHHARLSKRSCRPSLSPVKRFGGAPYPRELSLPLLRPPQAFWNWLRLEECVPSERPLRIAPPTSRNHVQMSRRPIPRTPRKTIRLSRYVVKLSQLLWTLSCATNDKRPSTDDDFAATIFSASSKAVDAMMQYRLYPPEAEGHWRTA